MKIGLEVGTEHRVETLPELLYQMAYRFHIQLTPHTYFFSQVVPMGQIT